MAFNDKPAVSGFAELQCLTDPNKWGVVRLLCWQAARVAVAELGEVERWEGTCVLGA